MLQKTSFVVAVFTACLSLGSAAFADSWKNESGHGKAKGKAKGHYKHEWNGHSGETPGWARGKGYWDGHDKHDRLPERYRANYDVYQGDHQYWDDQEYGNDHGQGYRYGNSPSHAPYSLHEPCRCPHCIPAPFSRRWDFEGSISIYPRSDW